LQAVEQQIIHRLDVFRKQSHERRPFDASWLTCAVRTTFPNTRFLVRRGLYAAGSTVASTALVAREIDMSLGLLADIRHTTGRSNECPAGSTGATGHRSSSSRNLGSARSCTDNASARPWFFDEARALRREFQF
jgi:hypothetical protein